MGFFSLEQTSARKRPVPYKRATSRETSPAHSTWSSNKNNSPSRRSSSRSSSWSSCSSNFSSSSFSSGIRSRTRSHSRSRRSSSSWSSQLSPRSGSEKPYHSSRSPSIQSCYSIHSSIFTSPQHSNASNTLNVWCSCKIEYSYPFHLINLLAIILRLSKSLIYYAAKCYLLQLHENRSRGTLYFILLF